MIEQDFEKFKARHQKLVYTQVSKIHLSNRKEDFEDLLNAGFVGLWKAWKAYDPSKGTRFSTSAVYLICGEVKNYLRDKSSLKSHFYEMQHAVSKDKPPAVQKVLKKKTVDLYPLAVAIANPIVFGQYDKRPTGSFEDTVEDPYSDIDNRLLLENVMGMLTPAEADIIRRLFYEQESVVEVAEALGLTKKVVSDIRNKALAKFKVNLKIEDFEV